MPFYGGSIRGVLAIAGLVVVAALLAWPGAAPAAQQGPVAAWSFDAGEGSTAEDVTGNGHAGTIEGAAWTSHGKFGDALELSGEEGECVAVPDSEALDLTEEFTLEAWVRPDSLEDAPILYKEGEGAIGYALGIGLLSEGRPEGFIGEGGGAYTDAGADPVEAGVWTHLAFTYDGRHMRVYEDGVLAGQNTQTTGALAAGGPLKIGCNPNYPETFDGRIDEVRIYERALSGADVAADMAAPLQTPPSRPVAAWSLDEGEGTTAVDATGDGHEGTIEGAEWTRGRYGAVLRFVQNQGRQCVTVADAPDLRLLPRHRLHRIRPGRGLVRRRSGLLARADRGRRLDPRRLHLRRRARPPLPGRRTGLRQAGRPAGTG